MFDDSDRDKLDKLTRRIEQARKAADPDQQQDRIDTTKRARSLVAAVKVGSDLVALIMGLGFFGWLLDSRLGTAPWLMLVFGVAGFIAGFWILLRLLFSKEDDEETEDETKEQKK